MGRLAAAALVDRDIYEDSAFLHFREIFCLKELGRGSAGDQRGSDDQVSVAHRSLDVGVIGDQRLDAGSEHVVQLLEALAADVDDRDVRAHADSDAAGIRADSAAAEDDDVRLGRSGDAGKKDAPSAELLLKVLGAFLNGEPPRDLAHRHEKRKRVVLLLQRLIGDALYFAGEERVRLLLVRCEVKVGVQDQTLVEQGIFGLKGLLDLDHHLGHFPDFRGIVDDHGACCRVFLVAEPGATSGPLLYIYFVPRGNVGAGVVRRNAYAEFVVLDLFGTADLHKDLLSQITKKASGCLFIITETLPVSLCM